MRFKDLKSCVAFLHREGELVRVSERVDPELEMAEITRRVFQNRGPAVFFENIKGCRFPAVSNLFGKYDRALKIFEPEFERIKQLIKLKSDPGQFFRSPCKNIRAVSSLVHALPIKQKYAKVMERQCSLSDLPMIRCWPKDGGAFILLPQVFSMDPSKNSIKSSNLGMYRVQISGGEYIEGKEAGLHYQIHRGIGNHHRKAVNMNRPLRVSIFIGGPPAHTLAAVMPMPENLSELFFAGAMAGRNFRYCIHDGFVVSADADFCITGQVLTSKTKKEGPFGDHLGYYSMVHDFPCMTVESVRHRKDAIYPFTVVGRPPQEDTVFGKVIHEIAGLEIPRMLPGVTQVHAVDAAGVHPLLFAKAKERYEPYNEREPREILTHANAILGTGQLSLAKYLLICADEESVGIDITDERAFFSHIFERVDFTRDLHFQTNTTIDTLDYASQGLNRGSKVIIAAAGKKRRSLLSVLPSGFHLPVPFSEPAMASPGVVVLKGPPFSGYQNAEKEMADLAAYLEGNRWRVPGLPLFVVADDPRYTCLNFSNFLWVTFTRSNPSHDIYGVKSFVRFKHWGCTEPLIIDARKKPFHAPVLENDETVGKKVDSLGLKGKSLYGLV